MRAEFLGILEKESKLLMTPERQTNPSKKHSQSESPTEVDSSEHKDGEIEMGSLKSDGLPPEDDSTYIDQDDTSSLLAM